MFAVLKEVFDERERQDRLWGEQNYVDGTGRHTAATELRMARVSFDMAKLNKALTWRHILDEEVAEAYAESDPARLRTELIQIAAVCIAWCQAIDRRVKK